MLSVNLNRETPWSSGTPYDILKVLGGSDKTMVVGGAVRDWLNEEPVKDIDFATKLLPKEAMQALLDFGFNVKPTGIEHGTITVYNNNNSYEITSLRKDILTDGRHAEVVFGGTWEDDANRRDFTVNALYADEYGSILDPTGEGFRDLESKKLKFIGSPSKRIKEDYLRILRYFRFLSKFLGNIDKQSLDACIKYAKNLNILSYERVLLEFNKILISDNSIIVIEKMNKNKILMNLFIQASIDNYKLNNNILKKILFKLKDYSNRTNYPFIFYISFVIALLTQKESNKTRILSVMTEKFKLSNIDKRLLTRNINWLIGTEKISKASVINLWLDFGERDVKDLKDILLIKNNSIKNNLVFYLNNPPPNFPVSGKDLLNIGLKEGKELGDALSKIRDWWIYKNCKPSHNECLDKVKSL
jgi:poly(A) polymerase